MTAAVSVALGVIAGDVEVSDIYRLVAVAVVEHDTLCSVRYSDDELPLAKTVDGLFRHGLAWPS